MVSLGLINANYVRMVPNPKVPHDFPSIRIEMNENVSDSATIDALKIVEQTVLDIDKQIVDEFGTGMIRDRLVFNKQRTEGEVITP